MKYLIFSLLLVSCNLVEPITPENFLSLQNDIPIQQELNHSYDIYSALCTVKWNGEYWEITQPNRNIDFSISFYIKSKNLTSAYWCPNELGTMTAFVKDCLDECPENTLQEGQILEWYAIGSTTNGHTKIKEIQLIKL